MVTSAVSWMAVADNIGSISQARVTGNKGDVLDPSQTIWTFLGLPIGNVANTKLNYPLSLRVKPEYVVSRVHPVSRH